MLPDCRREVASLLAAVVGAWRCLGAGRAAGRFGRRSGFCRGRSERRVRRDQCGVFCQLHRRTNMVRGQRRIACRQRPAGGRERLRAVRRLARGRRLPLAERCGLGVCRRRPARERHPFYRNVAAEPGRAVRGERNGANLPELERRRRVGLRRPRDGRRRLYRHLGVACRSRPAVCLEFKRRGSARASVAEHERRRKLGRGSLRPCRDRRRCLRNGCAGNGVDCDWRRSVRHYRRRRRLYRAVFGNGTFPGRCGFSAGFADRLRRDRGRQRHPHDGRRAKLGFDCRRTAAGEHFASGSDGTERFCGS